MPVPVIPTSVACICAYVVCCGCLKGLATGRIFRCMGLGGRERVLEGQSPLGGRGLGAAYRQVSHLLTGWCGLPRAVSAHLLKKNWWLVLNNPSIEESIN